MGGGIGSAPPLAILVPQRRLNGVWVGCRLKKKKKTLFFDAEKKLLLGNFEENSFVKRARVLASTQIGAGKKSHCHRKTAITFDRSNIF